jgi:hypothetical protein
MGAVTPLQINGTVPVSPIAQGLPPISSDWRLFFTTLVNRTGGSQGTDVNNVTIKSSQITDAGATGIAVLQSATPVAARTVIGAGTSDLTLQQIASSIEGTGISSSYDSQANEIALTLTPTGVTAGIYGGVGQSAAFTVGADGRLTAASSVPNTPDLATLWMYSG